MNQQGQWQVVGSAPEVYERELVPAVFGGWAPILVELAQPAQASALSMSRAVLVLWRASPQRASVQLALWLGLISIPEC
jgi:hypothetical protein